MIIGSKDFDTGCHTYLMAIVNLTPDSFFAGSRVTADDRLRERVSQIEADGGDILDLGAESTRPGHTPVSEQEEMDRLLPALELVKRHSPLPVSVDTTKPAVAREALRLGCDMINTVEGFLSEEMGRLLAESGVPCCLMHNRSLRTFSQDLREIAERAARFGIDRGQVILDPGIGFGKSQEENLLLLNHMQAWMPGDMPWLLGASRKSVIGNVLELPAEERLEGTLTTTVLAVLAGCSFVRVHDVKENRRCIRMAEAISAGGRSYLREG